MLPGVEPLVVASGEEVDDLRHARTGLWSSTSTQRSSATGGVTTLGLSESAQIYSRQTF